MSMSLIISKMIHFADVTLSTLNTSQPIILNHESFSRMVSVYQPAQRCECRWTWPVTWQDECHPGLGCRRLPPPFGTRPCQVSWWPPEGDRDIVRVKLFRIQSQSQVGQSSRLHHGDDVVVHKRDGRSFIKTEQNQTKPLRSFGKWGIKLARGYTDSLVRTKPKKMI